MNSSSETPAQPPAPSETTELLRRVLDAVEKNKPPERQEWAEIVCAVILSLATVASAWCAYQATLWGGVQTFRLAAANKAGRSASAHTLVAMQQRAFDATMLIHFLEAQQRGDRTLEEFLRARFRPEVRPALEVWLRSDPVQNPKAPILFALPEYVQAELVQARREEEVSTERHAAANQANETSDRYVLLTVLFAAVLFLIGIGATFGSRWMRAAFGIVALVLFLSTLAFLATMPVCRE